MKLDLYYARQFLTWFVIISGLLMTLVLLIDFSEQLRRFDDVELSVRQYLALAFLKSPAAFYTFLPLIMILTTIVLFIGLARSSELVVTRALGRSGLRALVPPIVMALLIGGLAVGLLNPIVAATSNRYKTLSEQYRNADTAAVSFTGEGLWLRQGGSTGQSVIRADTYSGDADMLLLFDVSILAYDAAGAPYSLTFASQARLGDGDWLLKNAKVWPLAPGLNPELRASEKDELWVPTTLTNEQIRETLGRSDGISVYDLPKTIAALQQAGFSSTRFRVLLQVEMARPLLLVAMVMVGAAFTMRHARLGGTGLAVLASMLLGFGLYFVHSFAQILGENGQIPVALAAWAPPVSSILLTMGLLLHAEDG